MSAATTELWVEAAVPEHLEGARDPGPVHESVPGQVLVRLPGLARALVTLDAPPRIERAAGVGDADLDWLARGPLRHAGDVLRGDFALRAAAVAIGDRAVALVAGGAGGKSFLAAALARRGHAVLADSYLPVGVEERAIARAQTCRLELWPRGVRLLGLDPEAGAEVRSGLSKRALAFDAAASAPLGLVVRLRRESEHAEPSLEPLRGGALMSSLIFATAMRPPIDGAGLGSDHFRWAVAVGQRTRGAVLHVPAFHEDPDALAALVEDAARDAGA